MSDELKTTDFDIRSALVRLLLHEGFEPSLIRHELTLDTSSIGGRSDVVLLAANKIIGIEIKSCRDKLDRLKEQVRAYDRAFDMTLVVAGPKHQKGLENIGGGGIAWRSLIFLPEAGLLRSVYGSSVPSLRNFIGGRDYRSRRTCPGDMASLLWKTEACAIAGLRAQKKFGTRCAAIEYIRENFSLRELRPKVIEALTERVRNEYERAFETRLAAKMMRETA